MNKITENYRKITELLFQATVQAKRPENSVRLLAVSKNQSLEAILQAASCGQRDFGENYLQESIKKIKNLNRENLIWHFIGHIQTNKTREIAENFDWVHTIDRLKTAERLSKQRPLYAENLNICIQVNIDSEKGKYGVTVDNLLELSQAIIDLPKLTLRGLMCIPAIYHEYKDQRKPFAKLRYQMNFLEKHKLKLDTLSMGMTNDYKAAIIEGATMVRIGTALFGERQKS